MMTQLLASLNPAQRAAVEYCSGPQLVIAGAGSGKTRVLTYKIAHLLELGIEPDRIMALTFTNKAAREMQERIAALVDSDKARRLWMGTFHSILLRMLRLHADRLGFRYDFTIYDAADSRSLVKLIINELGLDEKQYKPSSVAGAISNAKNALISPQRYAVNKDITTADNRAGRPLIARIYKMYCERCRLAQTMDFDDILVYANVLLRDNPDLTDYYSKWFQYVLVDEYQDTNFAQSLIVSRLVSGHGHLCVVGDDAQSIYSFRGANIENILGMQQRYPGLQLFKLERNYRSTKNIVEAAGSLIKYNPNQIPKNVYSENETGEKLQVVEAFTDIEEASLVAAAVSRRIHNSPGKTLEDMAILYRTNAQSRLLEEALRRRAIPYRIYGGLTFYQRKEVKDAIAYFRLAVNPDDDEALRRIINFPARGIGDTTMKKVRAVAMERGLSMWKVVADPSAVALNINKGTAAKLKAFADMMKEFQAEAEKVNAYDLGRDIFNRTGLFVQYAQSAVPEEISKHENLYELLGALKEYVERPRIDADNVGMSAFLSEVSLLTDQDNEEDDDTPKLTLMTVHAAKGLEFDHVFITGLEENLFPGSQAVESPPEMEEERRLLYVAITRARKTVLLSYSRQRFRNGSTTDTIPSRFLQEINPQYLSGNVSRPTYGYGGNSGNGGYGSYGGYGQQQAPRRFFKNEDRGYVKPRNLVPLKPKKTRQAPFAVPADAPYKPGDRVEHAKFGAGEVVNYTSDPEPIVEVNFEGFGLKRLILRFASLQKL